MSQVHELPTYTTPCEIVHQKAPPSTISEMLLLRLQDGWILDRIIDHMVLEQCLRPANYKPEIVYYFKKIRY